MFIPCTKRPKKFFATARVQKSLRRSGPRRRIGPIGLVLHDTMAFNLEGTPLGLMNVQCWARAFAEAGSKKRRPKESPIAEKESHNWLVSYRAVVAAQKHCPQTMLVSVGDREADVYELFHEALSDPQNPQLLIRANRDRLLNEGQEHLWDYVKTQSLRGTQHVQVPRQGPRPALEAELEIRFAQVTLKPPELKPELGELIPTCRELPRWRSIMRRKSRSPSNGCC